MPELTVIPPIFTAGISVKELSVFAGFYIDKAMFLIWRCISLSPNDIYLCLHCLKEICGLVQHYHIIFYVIVGPGMNYIEKFPLL